MAIRLASAIGSQRTPVDILGGLDDAINKTGDAISEGIKARREEEAKKTALKQATKDAILKSVKVDPTGGHPEQVKAYEEYLKNGFSNLYVLRNDPNTNPDVYDKAAKDFEYGAKQRAMKYKEDAEAYEESGKMQDAYHLDEFAGFLTGTPEQQVEEDDPAAVAQYNDAKNKIEEDRKYWDKDVDTYTANTPEQRAKLKDDINKKLDEKLAELKAPEKIKKTIKGQEGYWSLPFEEQLKTDLKAKLRETAIPVTPNAIDVAKGVLGSPYTMSYVTTIQKSDGSSDYAVDEKALEMDAESIADKFKNPPAVSPNKDFNLLNRSLEAQAIDYLLKNTPQGQITPEQIAETKKQLFKSKFLQEAESKIREDQLKMKEAALKSRSGSGSGAGSKEPKITKLEGTPDVPAIEQLKQDKVAAQQTKIDEYQNKINQYKRQADEASKKGDNDAAKRANHSLAIAQTTLAAIEKTKEMIENHKPNTSDVYVFSDKEESVDQALNFVGEGGLTIKAQPTTIFKMNGLTYIGGVVAEDGGFRDVYVPYDKNNKGILGVNKEKLVAEFDKRGFKTIEDEAASKNKGSSKGKSRQEISDQELENF